jgi:hypothetical protein
MLELPRLAWLTIGNCDICAEGKISFMNEIKRNKIWPRPKGWVQKIFQTLLANFSKGLNESYHKFHPIEQHALDTVAEKTIV